jgi:D-galactarolactone cycloisomerase
MEIVSIEAIPLEHTLDSLQYVGDARGRSDTRGTTLIRVETDEDITGWGEAFAPPQTTVTLIEELIDEHVIGMDPFDIESFVLESYTRDYHFSRSAILRSAIAGIDIACWDVIGKATGRPIHQFIGGGTADSVRAYASTGYFTEPESELARTLEAAVENGFTAAKIKIGRGIEDDIERVATAREILGEDAHLMVDYNGNYRPKQAIRSLEGIQSYTPTWAEEPVPPENITGYRDVRSSVSIPLAAGEAHFSRFEFERLTDGATVDVVQPNLGRTGFVEAGFITDSATTANLAVRPHVWNSGIGVAAALQFAVSVPEYPHTVNTPEPMLLEFDRSDNPLRDEILAEPFDPAGGRLEIPDEPGLGVDIDLDAVDRYRIER